MHDDERSSLEALRERIASRHGELLARCFAAGDEKAPDNAVAAQYAAVLAELAHLPRNDFLALRFLASGRDAGAPRPENGIRHADIELLALRRLADSAGFGFAVADTDGILVYANAALCRLLGLPAPQDAIGRQLLDHYRDEDRELLSVTILPTVIGRGHWSGDLGLRAATGSEVPTIQSLFAVRGEPGAPLRLAVLVLDITERKRAEDALRASEERLREIFENTTIGIYRTTPDGRVLTANPALQKMLGYASLDDLARVNLEDGSSYSPQYPRSAFKERIAREGRITGHEAVWLRPDGSALYVRESARAVRDQAGRVVYYEGTVEDVSEVHRAQAALQASEESFRALADNANDGILIVTSEGRHLYANRRAAEITGYPLAELISGSYRDLASPEELPRIVARYEQLPPGRAVPRRHETRIVAKDGRHVPIDLSGAPTVWQGQTADIIIFRDITNRKLVEQELRESQDKFRNLVESIGEIIYEVDDQGTVVYVSPAIHTVLGWHPAELIGRPLWDFVPEDELPAARAATAALGSGQPDASGEHRVRTKGGEIRWVRHSSRPITLGGRFTGARGVVIDVTEAHLAKEALQETEDRYATMVERAMDGVLIIQDERVRFANPAIARAIGREPAEMLDMHFLDIVAPQSRPMAAQRYQRRLSGADEPDFYTLSVLHADGTSLEVEVAVSLIPLGGRPATMIVARETAQRKGRAGGAT